MLALQFYVIEHLLLDLFHHLGLVVGILSLCLGIVVDIGKRSGVDIERLHVNEDLIVVDLVHVVVQLVGGLRKNALGFDYSVCTESVSVFLHCFNMF